MFAPVETIASTMLFRSMSTMIFLSPAEISDPAQSKNHPAFLVAKHPVINLSRPRKIARAERHVLHRFHNRNDARSFGDVDVFDRFAKILGFVGGFIRFKEVWYSDQPCERLLRGLNVPMHKNKKATTASYGTPAKNFAATAIAGRVAFNKQYLRRWLRVRQENVRRLTENFYAGGRESSSTCSSQSRARASASRQRAVRLNASSRGMLGVKVRSTCQLDSTEARSFQKPVASPARYAAPSAVVSVTIGRTTGHA